MFVLSHCIMGAAAVSHWGRRAMLAAVVGSAFPDLPQVMMRVAPVLAPVGMLGERVSHSLVVVACCAAIGQVYLPNWGLQIWNAFCFGWFFHIIVDICSHHPPHPYFWPFGFALRSPDLWDHHWFWQATRFGELQGAFVESAIVAAIMIAALCIKRVIFGSWL